MARLSMNHRRAGAIALAVGALFALWLCRADLKGLGSVLWPVVLAGALIGFRAELSGLLLRLRRVGTAGAEFADVSIVAQITAMPIDQALQAVAPNETQTTYIRARVEALRMELNDREPDDPARREHLLMLRLAEAQQIRDWQSVWLNLFSSQLEALAAMAKVVDSLDLTPFYESHVQRREAMVVSGEQVLPALTFEVWTSFLGRMRLAVIAAHNGSITDEGRGLLEFGARFNLPRFHLL